MGYADQDATRVALAQAERWRTEARRLKQAIVDHYKAIHRHDWSQDDALWAEIGLVGDPDIIG